MNQRSYTKSVAKSLACSKATRDEFVRDLESDIAAALGAGEEWEQVERRMGDPRQVAAEFNENLSEAERAAGKKRRRNKVVGIVAAAAVVLVAAIGGATWWAAPHQGPTGQAAGLSEQEVVDRAEEAAGYMGSEDYGTLIGMFPESLRTGATEGMFADAREAVGGGDWGAFESFGNVYTVEVSQMGHAAEVVEMVAVYKNVVITYQMTFNENLELTNFFIK